MGWVQDKINNAKKKIKNTVNDVKDKVKDTIGNVKDNAKDIELKKVFGPMGAVYIGATLAGKDKIANTATTVNRVTGIITFSALAAAGLPINKLFGNPDRPTPDELDAINDLPPEAKKELQTASFNNKIGIIIVIGLILGLIYQYGIKKK